ncbi:MAG: trigger factor [Patescibacteria group bacterium]
MSKAKTKSKSKTKKHVHDENCKHDHDRSHNSMIAENDFIEVSIDWSEVEKAYKNILTQAAKGVKIAGFREGKVPTNIAKDKLDPEQLIGKTLEKVVPPVLKQEFEKLKDKYTPVSRPEVSPISTKMGEKWKVKVSFAQKPKIKVSKYKAIIKKARKLAETEIKKISAQGGRAKSKKPKLSKEQKEDITIRIIFRELIEEIKPEIQELLVREETNYKLQNVAEQLKRMKMSIEDYLAQRKIKFEEFASQIQAEALASLQLEFTINAISELEKITADAKEITTEIAKIKDEAMKKAYESNEYYQVRLKQNLIRKKTIDFLLSL